MNAKDLKPARVLPPGVTIRQELEARGWKQIQFAHLIERPVQFVSELLNAKRQVTPDTALRLEAALGPSAQFWMNLETSYRLSLAGREQAATIEKIRTKARDIAIA